MSISIPTEQRRQNWEIKGYVCIDHRNEGNQTILDMLQAHCHELINRALIVHADLPVSYELDLHLSERSRNLARLEGSGELSDQESVTNFIVQIRAFREKCEQVLTTGNGKTYSFTIKFGHSS